MITIARPLNKKGALSALLLFSVACCRREVGVAERHYESDENITGGFVKFDLRLQSNGEALLKVLTYSSTVVDDSVQLLIPDSLQVTGKWAQSGKQPTLVWHHGIEKAFALVRSEEDSLLKKRPVAFSQHLDTAFIFGIPATLVHDEK